MATVLSSNQAPESAIRWQRGTLPVPFPDACVLVVEDHEDTRFMLKTMLEMRGGISVVEASNGMKGIEVAERVRPDLILIAGNLPLIDGYEATRRLREIRSTREVPIVFLSGHAQPAAEAKAFAAGCSHYLVKPFNLDRLGDLLERYLSPGRAM